MIGRKWHFLSLLAALLLTLSFAGGISSPPALAAQQSMVKVLVAFKQTPGPNEQAIVRTAGGTIKYSYHLVPAVAATLPGAAVTALQHNPAVIRVEPDVEVHALDAYADELNNTWGVQRIGAGEVQADGNVGSGVKVAIIDTGIDYTHPELASIGSRCPGANCGYDFVNGDDDPMDDDGHGTHVAGTVAAARNGVGVVGVAPGVELYALKVLDANGRGSFSDVIEALQWAVDNKIQVTNNSYGSSTDPGQTVHDAFDAAYGEGVLSIASAGNSGNPPGKGDNVGYPAKYDSVVAVAATDSSDNRASFSSTGPAVELAAPGVSIYSTRMGGGYTTMSGTSMASPHVTGTAALVIGSGITGPANVRSRLVETATDLGPAGKDNYYGYGLVNAAKAAATGTVDNPPSVSWVNPVDGSTVSGTVAIQINAADAETTAGGLAVQWQVDKDNPQMATYNSTSRYYEASWDTASLSDGQHTLTALVTDSANQTASVTITVSVGNSSGGGTPLSVTGFSPQTLAAGSSAGMTVTGTGFRSGATVTFEGGTGPAPTASVSSVSGTSITGTVSAKSGGPSGNRAWNVRVTNPDGSSAVWGGVLTVQK